MAGVSHYETRAVVVHTSLAPADEQVPGLPHGTSAVQEGGAYGGGAVAGGRAQGKLVTVPSDTAKMRSEKVRESPQM